MFQAASLIAIALLLAGCTIPTHSSSDSSYTPTSRWWIDYSADEADMDIDSLLIKRARFEGLPMTKVHLNRLKSRFTEDELRNGSVGATMHGEPCYVYEHGEDGFSCYLIWDESVFTAS